MATAVTEDSQTLTFDVRPLKMTDVIFYEFCQRNKDFRFEMDKRGNLIIMPPTFLETSRRNARINVKLGIWAEKNDTGIAFESDGMFTLPNGAKRAPDAFWITKEKYYALSEEERENRFANRAGFRHRSAVEIRQSAQIAGENARIHRKRRFVRLAD